MEWGIPSDSRPQGLGSMHSQCTEVLHYALLMLGSCSVMLGSCTQHLSDEDT